MMKYHDIDEDGKMTPCNETPEVGLSTAERVVMPLSLMDELRAEAAITENRNGDLCAIAAAEIDRLRSYLDCDPAVTLCPKCGNDIIKCDRFFKA